MSGDRYCLINGTVITPHRMMPCSAVLVDGATIAAVYGPGDLPDDIDCKMVDVAGAYIAPGFIDIHLHGAGGYDVMDGTCEAFAGMARAHARGGTTAIVPSTITSSHEDLITVLDAFERSFGKPTGGASLLGIHLEGPYFAVSQRGAQDERYIKCPDVDEYMAILDAYPHIIRVSAAPELPGALELGRVLRSRGILASIGHTDASYDQVIAGIEAGYTHVTHLYSGMAGVRRVRAYRVAGAVEGALLLDDLTVEIIADGRHLPASLLQLIYKCKGSAQIALCTDSIGAAGMPEGDYKLGSSENGQTVIVDEGVAWLPDRSAFAGSVAQANWLVRNMVQLAGTTLTDAVKMATLTPARILGVSSRKGSLDAGKDADIVVFDRDVEVKLTIVGGKIVYQKRREDN